MFVDLIRNFSFSEHRLKEVNEQHFRQELSAIINDEKMAEYFITLAKTGAKTKDNCSHVAFVMGVSDKRPTKEGPVYLDGDLADCDIDFSDREAAFAHLSEVYGREHVAKLGAVALYQSKNSAAETCKALSIPKYEIEPVLASVVSYAAGDDRTETALKEAFGSPKGKSFLAKYPHAVCAGDMGGNPRHASTHASAIVITNEPIAKYAAIDERVQTAQIEKSDAENRGLLKLDVLGLINLEIFSETLKLVGLPLSTFDNLDYKDQSVFDVLNDGKFTSVFQFEGKAVKKLAEMVRIESLDDLSALSALARPGPLASGGAENWVKRRNGTDPVSYPHELLEPFLRDTLGTLVFQETIMRIAKELCGMDWVAVAALRKAIAKSQGSQKLEIHGEPFRNGMIKAGVPEGVAAQFWKAVIEFGAYSFNQAHAIAYAMISYQSLYLKRHYPLEFAAANLSFRTKVENQVELLRELAAEGVSYVPVDPEHSTDKWRVVTKDGVKSLVGPITLVKGLGPRMCSQVLSCRARGEPIPERAAKLLDNPVTEIDSLFPIEKAISEIDLSNFSFSRKPKKCNEIVCTGDWEDDTVLLGLVTSFKERDDNEPQMVEGRISRGQTGIKTGLTTFLDIRVADSTGECYYKIEAKNLEEMTSGLELVENKTLVAVRGTICPDVPMVLCKQIRVIGNV